MHLKHADLVKWLNSWGLVLLPFWDMSIENKDRVKFFHNIQYSQLSTKERGRNKFAILSVEAPAWQGAKV